MAKTALLLLAACARTAAAATAAATAMKGEAPLMTRNTYKAGAVVSSSVLSLKHTTALASGDTITCTFDAALFTADAVVTVSVTGPGSGMTATGAAVGKILTITATSAIPAYAMRDAISYSLESNLKANPAASGSVGVSCVSTKDTVPLAVRAFKTSEHGHGTADCTAFLTKATTADAGAAPTIVSADLNACQTKVFGFLRKSGGQTKAQVSTICDKTDTSAQSLGTCIELFETMKKHYKANKMMRCQAAMMPVAAVEMMCVKDDAKAYCPFVGYNELYAAMPYFKIFTGAQGYHPDCGETFPSLKGGVAGVTETSTNGGNTVEFSIANPGSGQYTFTQNIPGTSSGQYVVGDTIKILGTSLGGATPANDCTVNYASTGRTNFDGTTRYEWRITDDQKKYNAGTPKTLVKAKEDACFETEMATTCSVCTLKSTEAALVYMMGDASDPSAAKNAAKNAEMIGLLNDASCSKVKDEGYCAKSFAGVMNTFESRKAEAKNNPYCDKTKVCPKKFFAMYAGAMGAAMGPSSAAQFDKMMSFACVINPENKDYCMDVVKGTTAPWGTPECVTLLGEMEGPTLANSATWSMDKLKPSGCGKDLRTANDKYGCCISSIATMVDNPLMLSMFKNAGATVEPECNLMAAKGHATLKFEGVTKEWLEENEGLIKSDIMASGGLTPKTIGTIEIKEEVITRRRLGDSSFSADMRAMEAELMQLGISPEMRKHHRRLAATRTTATVVYGSQDAKDTAQVTSKLTAEGGFQPMLLMKEAALDGESLEVTGVAAEDDEVPKKKSRLGAWADWMHQDCPTAEEDGNPWWCAAVVLIGSGALAVTVVVAAIGIVIAIVVVKKKNAAKAAAFEDEGNKKTVVSGTVVEMTNPANDI